MAFRKLIINANFILGFILGIILTFGRGYFPVLEQILKPVFNFWVKVWPAGILLDIVPLYISGLVIFILIWLTFLTKKQYSFIYSLKLFSLGFLLFFIVFLFLSLIAISQFKFTQ